MALNENESQSKSNEAREGGAKKKTYIDKDTNQEFEHAPAKNMTEVKEQKDFKQKLEEQREKRKLLEKGLGASTAQGFKSHHHLRQALG